jgi:hypothetical protein
MSQNNSNKKNNKSKRTQYSKKEEKGSTTKTTLQKICKNFQKGECKYGNKCKFAHVEVVFLEKDETPLNRPEKGSKRSLTAQWDAKSDLVPPMEQQVPEEATSEEQKEPNPNNQPKEGMCEIFAAVAPKFHSAARSVTKKFDLWCEDLESSNNFEDFIYYTPNKSFTSSERLAMRQVYPNFGKLPEQYVAEYNTVNEKWMATLGEECGVAVKYDKDCQPRVAERVHNAAMQIGKFAPAILLNKLYHLKKDGEVLVLNVGGHRHTKWFLESYVKETYDAGYKVADIVVSESSHSSTNILHDNAYEVLPQEEGGFTFYNHSTELYLEVTGYDAVAVFNYQNYEAHSDFMESVCKAAGVNHFYGVHADLRYMEDDYVDVQKSYIFNRDTPYAIFQGKWYKDVNQYFAFSTERWATTEERNLGGQYFYRSVLSESQKAIEDFGKRSYKVRKYQADKDLRDAIVTAETSKDLKKMKLYLLKETKATEWIYWHAKGIQKATFVNLPGNDPMNSSAARNLRVVITSDPDFSENETVLAEIGVTLDRLIRGTIAKYNYDYLMEEVDNYRFEEELIRPALVERAQEKKKPRTLKESWEHFIKREMFYVKWSFAICLVLLMVFSFPFSRQMSVRDSWATWYASGCYETRTYSLRELLNFLTLGGKDPSCAQFSPGFWNILKDGWAGLKGQDRITVQENIFPSMLPREVLLVIFCIIIPFVEEHYKHKYGLKAAMFLMFVEVGYYASLTPVVHVLLYVVTSRIPYPMYFSVPLHSAWNLYAILTREVNPLGIIVVFTGIGGNMVIRYVVDENVIDTCKKVSMGSLNIARSILSHMQQGQALDTDYGIGFYRLAEEDTGMYPATNFPPEVLKTFDTYDYPKVLDEEVAKEVEPQEKTMWLVGANSTLGLYTGGTQMVAAAMIYRFYRKLSGDCECKFGQAKCRIGESVQYYVEKYGSTIKEQLYVTGPVQTVQEYINSVEDGQKRAIYQRTYDRTVYEKFEPEVLRAQGKTNEMLLPRVEIVDGIPRYYFKQRIYYPFSTVLNIYMAPYVDAIMKNFKRDDLSITMRGHEVNYRCASGMNSDALTAWGREAQRSVNSKILVQGDDSILRYNGQRFTKLTLCLDYKSFDRSSNVHFHKWSFDLIKFAASLPDTFMDQVIEAYHPKFLKLKLSARRQVFCKILEWWMEWSGSFKTTLHNSLENVLINLSVMEFIVDYGPSLDQIEKIVESFGVKCSMIDVTPDIQGSVFLKNTWYPTVDNNIGAAPLVSQIICKAPKISKDPHKLVKDMIQYLKPNDERRIIWAEQPYNVAAYLCSFYCGRKIPNIPIIREYLTALRGMGDHLFNEWDDPERVENYYFQQHDKQWNDLRRASCDFDYQKSGWLISDMYGLDYTALQTICHLISCLRSPFDFITNFNLNLIVLKDNPMQ